MFELFVVKLIAAIALLSVAVRILFLEAESIAAGFRRLRKFGAIKRD